MIDTKALREAAELAEVELARLCNGGKFTMCIPVQESDSDIVLGNAIRSVYELLDRLEKLEAVADVVRNKKRRN